MQECFSIWKSINLITYHINRLKKKKHMITSINAEKVFYNCPCPLMTQTLQKRNRGDFLTWQRTSTKKPTANITLNGKIKLNAFLFHLFPIWQGTKWEYLFLPLSCNIVLEISASAIKQRMEIKGLKTEGEESCSHLQMTSLLRKSQGI